jgi:hypothetical protein
MVVPVGVILPRIRYYFSALHRKQTMAFFDNAVQAQTLLMGLCLIEYCRLYLPQVLEVIKQFLSGRRIADGSVHG